MAQKPPVTYFGRKDKAAPKIWELLGSNLHTYVEPFVGSMAVWLQRPEDLKETICRLGDLDGFVVNAWRALEHEPLWVARKVTRPISQTDLTAMHIYIVERREDLVARLKGDPDYYDRKIAAYWIYGINSWIGRNFGYSNGPWIRDPETGMCVKREKTEQEGVEGTKPNHRHQGVHSMPEGVWDQKSNHRHKGVHSMPEGTEPGLYQRKLSRNRKWLEWVRDSLMRATIACNSWEQVVTATYTHENKKKTTVGVYMDPPYDESVCRNKAVYGKRSGHTSVSKDVEQWCIDNGNDERLRIVLSGYDEEHDALLEHGWTKHTWGVKKSAGYGGKNTDKHAKTEYLWASPTCLSPVDGRSQQL